MFRQLCGTAALLVLCASALSGQQYATSIFDIVQGPGSGLFTTTSALGGPDYVSSGFFSIYSLGAGGRATFGFGDAIRDGEALYFDDDHMSLAGARLASRHIATLME